MKAGQKVYYISVVASSGHRIVSEAKRLAPGTEGGMVKLETIPHNLYAGNVKPPRDYKPDKPKIIYLPEGEFWTDRSVAVRSLLYKTADDIERLLGDLRRYIGDQ
jgi:hypothetical protein